MAHSCSRGSNATRWRSYEAATAAWMVAMAATKAESLDGATARGGAQVTSTTGGR
jgi:ABC-type branched-subunit amino acid transport system substrate-binding protein